MHKKVKETLCGSLVVIATAVLFFVLGMAATHLLGRNDWTTTKVIYVTEPATTTTTSVVPLPTDADGRININVATKDDLMTINGIGDTIAGRIIEYRTKYGPFTSLDQLLEIEKIGEKTLEKWKPFLTVG